MDDESWECPHCGKINNQCVETYVCCDSCGDHPALYCEHCEEFVDLIYWNV